MNRSAPGHAALLVALGLSAACGESEPQGSPVESSAADTASAPDVPEGTVLVVDDVPILAQDVDAVAERVSVAFPEYTRVHCRRLALTNLFLERAAGLSGNEAERQRALEEARRARAKLIALEPGTEAWSLGLEVAQVGGRIGGLDFDLWTGLEGLEIGAWSEPLDLVGRISLVRIVTADGPTSSPHTRYELEVMRFPYVGTAASRYLDRIEALEREVAAAHLRVVDPGWEEVVPETWRYRMTGRP